MAAANDKKPTIVIKKITVVAGGGHGGSWKVAFADFMTAMMAFFLVMWLVNQTEEVKKSVAEYFSTPSIIEYNFSNYGVELTLEKLFLDLVNEPLKAFEQFIKPADNTPNVMDMGHKKIQFEFLRNKLGEFNIQIETLTDEITFEIPSNLLFVAGSARPGTQFVPIMERVREIVQGLKDANIHINAEEPLFKSDNATARRNLAEARLDLIAQKIEVSKEGDNVDIFGKTTIEPIIVGKQTDTRGYIKFRIRQKQFNDTDKKDQAERSTSSVREAKIGEMPTSESMTQPLDKPLDEPFSSEETYSDFVDSVSGKGTR